MIAITRALMGTAHRQQVMGSCTKLDELPTTFAGGRGCPV